MTQTLPKQCAEKLAFDSQKQANAAALTAELQRAIKLKSYQCKHCNLWHLATKYD